MKPSNFCLISMLAGCPIEDSVTPEQRSAIAASFSSVPQRSRELNQAV